MSRYEYERQQRPYKKPEEPSSPVKKRIMNRLPIETIFDDIQEIIRIDYDTGRQIYMAIREFFYVAYQRDTGTRDNSILSCIDRELRTGKRIWGLDHKIKAACTYKCVAKAIDKISNLLEQEIEYTEGLIQFQLYLTTLKSRLGRELIQIPGVEKREEIKRKTGLDLDLITVDPIASPHKRALEAFHLSPKKNPNGSTPKRVRKNRRQAQWKMATFMGEEKERRKANKLPKSAAVLFGGQENVLREVDPNTGLSPWVSSSDSDSGLSLPKTPVTKLQNKARVSFKIKQKSRMTLKDKKRKPFNLFTEIARKAERQGEFQKIAASDELELGHHR